MVMTTDRGCLPCDLLVVVGGDLQFSELQVGHSVGPVHQSRRHDALYDMNQPTNGRPESVLTMLTRLEIICSEIFNCRCD